jgi:cysteinyl-tRNA synthetase
MGVYLDDILLGQGTSSTKKKAEQKAAKDAFEKMLQVFGIVFEEEVLDEDIEKLIEERQAARANKDFATADRIRDELAAQGIKLLDTKDGVRWTRD